MAVSYELAEISWDRFPALVRTALETPEVSLACELGAGARPLVDLDVAQAASVSYSLVDISASELAKAPEGYVKVEADVTSPDFKPADRYDLVFSRTLVEHLQEPVQFHRNVLAMLKPGGRAMHFFPTLYAPPFLFNRLVPEKVTEPLLHRLQPGMRDPEGDHGKFPPFYRWCRGPSKRQLRRFESLGYVVDEYVGFFGHSYYKRVPALDRANDRLAEQLVRHPHPALTTYAQVVLRRP